MEFNIIRLGCTYLAADTIFMDCVIFWMFFTDFNRMEMAFKVAMLRLCWAYTPFPMIAFTAGAAPLIFCIHIYGRRIERRKAWYNRLNSYSQMKINKKKLSKKKVYWIRFWTPQKWYIIMHCMNHFNQSIKSPNCARHLPFSMFLIIYDIGMLKST